VIRRLLWLLAVIGVFWLVRRLMGQRSAPRTSRTASLRFEGAMVRDRICETFLPRSRALTVRENDREHFFCSENCRSTFLARQNATR
jgi:hypothetical protein